MRIPHRVVGQVRPARQARPYLQDSASPGAFGVGVAQSVQKFGESIGQLGSELQRQKDKLNNFNARKAFVKEAGELQQDFHQRKINAPLGAPNFTEETLDTYQERGRSLISDLREQGVPQEQLQSLELSLMRMHQSYAGQAMNFELQSQGAKVGFDIQELNEDLTRIVQANPDEIEAAEQALNETIDSLPDIDAVTREELRQKGQRLISLTAGISLADQDAHRVRSTLRGTPQDADEFVQVMKESIASNETGGIAKPYQAVGSAVQRKNGTDRPYGKYQVMGSNIPKWTKDVTGTAATPEEFLANPQLQEAVFEFQMRRLFKKHGNVRDAASVWFTGVPYDQAVREGRTDQVNGLSIQQYVAKIEGNPSLTMTDGQTGDPVLDRLDGPQRQKVLSAADAEMARQEARDKKERDAAIRRMDGLVNAAESEVLNGWMPSFERARQTAQAVGGIEGEVALQELDFLEQSADSATRFASTDAFGRSVVLREMEEARGKGMLNEQGQKLHDLLDKVDKNIRSEAARDGYGQAVRSRLIEEPVPLTLNDPEVMAQRETQAQLIKDSFGSDASVTTESERNEIVSAIRGSREQGYHVMQALAGSPNVKQDIQRALAKEGTAEARALAVTFDLAEQGDEVNAKAIMKGQALLAEGEPDIPSSVWVTAQNNAYGGMFEGMEAVAASYRDAAIAHYVGTRGQVEEGSLISPSALQDSLRAVLPGQVIDNTPGVFSFATPLISPSKAIGQDEWTSRVQETLDNPDWWQNRAKWWDPASGNYYPAEEPPRYPDGEEISASDIFEDGTLRMAGKGRYRAFTSGGGIAMGQFRLVIDMNEAR